MTPPLIGIAASTGAQYGQPAQLALDQYIAAVAAVGAIPVLVPSTVGASEPEALLDRLDGLLLPGDRSNIHPSRYGGSPPPGTEILDPARDASTLRLIPAALERGVPLLAICRGFEELNVALGGTLHRRVHEVAGLADHRAPTELPMERRFAPAHDVILTADGLLASLNGGDRHARVNSLHAQGLFRLAPGLSVEARAPDGLIEAVQVEWAQAFALGVQWHPEWKVLENPFYRAIFAAFIEATHE